MCLSGGFQPTIQTATTVALGQMFTLARALAAAWILSHDDIADRFGRVALGMRDFDCVPRHVPDGWTFEIDDMPAEGHG